MKTIPWIRTREILAILCIFIFSYAVRLDGLSQPTVDGNAWRQSETLAVAENFISNGFNILRPQTNTLRKGGTNKLLFIAEFPVYEYLLAGLLVLFDHSIVIAHTYSTFLTALTAIAIFLIGYELFSFAPGIIAAFLFNLLPASVFWGRSILPDVLALSCSTWALLFILRFNQHHKHSLFTASAFFLSIAIVNKPFYLALLFPVVYILIYKNNHRVSKKLFLYICITAVPFLAWRLYGVSISPEYQYPHQLVPYLWEEPSPFTYLESTAWIGVFLKERLFDQLTPLGGVLLIGSLFSLQMERFKKNVIYLWLASIILILITVVWGNFNHEYYQIFLLPFAALIIGIKIHGIFLNIVKYRFLYWRIGLTMPLVIFVAYYVWLLPYGVTLNRLYRPEVKYNLFSSDIGETNSLFTSTDRLLTYDELEMGSPTLLNHIGKPGWTLNTEHMCRGNQIQTIEFYRTLGATKFVFPRESYYFRTDRSCNRATLLTSLASCYAAIYKGTYLYVFDVQSPCVNISMH